MKNLTIFTLTFLAFAYGFVQNSYAQDPCAKYYGKGYCVDYIQQRLGKRPRGNAGTWSPNIDAKTVKAGDVAIFSSPAPWGHVAIVERVIYERNTDKPYQIDISEWNWGIASTKPEERACAVTQKFGKPTYRTVRVTTVKGYWRP